MTPVLLDQTRIFRAGLAVVVAMAVVFVSGYYVGYQKAGAGKGVDLNKTMVLALPRPAHADAAEFEPSIPNVQTPGAEIDVDSPEVSADAGIVEHQMDLPVTPAETQVTTVSEQTAQAIEASAHGDEQHEAAQQSLQLASLTAAGDSQSVAKQANAESSAHSVRQSASILNAGSQAAITDNASAEEARYTIQVGVFADVENAMRKKTELESHQLSAYVTEYTNKRDQPRFNVRFGYFKDRSGASAALAHFEQNMSGSGYVTRISRN